MPKGMEYIEASYYAPLYVPLKHSTLIRFRLAILLSNTVDSPSIPLVAERLAFVVLCPANAVAESVAVSIIASTTRIALIFVPLRFFDC